MLKRITTPDVEPTDLDVALAPRLDLLAGVHSWRRAER